MLLKKEREAVVRYARLLQPRGLTRGTGGNISILCREENLVAITPSGVEYEEMSPADVTVTDRAGKTADGALKPSSELMMHLACYDARPDAAAVVHTHSTYATVVACMREKLPAIHYLIGFAGGEVPCIPYYPYGSQALAEAVGAAIRERNAVLLGNHGLTACGPDIAYAFSVAEETEFVAELYVRTRQLGGGTLLTDAELAEAMRRFESYGQKQK